MSKKYPKSPTVGAPLTLTKKMIKEVEKYLKIGCYVETAVVMAGIGKTTFYTWMKESHKEDCSEPLYVELRVAVERAVEEAEARDLMNIERAAMGKRQEYERDEKGQVLFDGKGKPVVKEFGMAPDWSASAWRLERKNPKRWARTDKVAETDLNDNNLVVEFVESDEQA